VKTEDDPLDPTPLPAVRETAAAMRYLDEAVADAGELALLCQPRGDVHVSRPCPASAAAVIASASIQTSSDPNSG